MLFDNGINEIKGLLTSFLGEPKNDNTEGWIQFCCPCCAERKCVESDGKYNLEVNIEKGVYHCWVCGDTDDMKGKISQLIRKYGNQQLLSEYYTIIKNIKESSLYCLYGGDKFNDDFIDDVQEVYLPFGCKPITKEDKNAEEAYEYLIKRGLDEYFIKTYNLKYIGDDEKKPVMKNRIIIPSYDMYGNLNYWVGRDYRGDAFLRYKNPKIEKTKFIFNEKFVNWYENITLVEGVFDHMVVPNSIPLLGKTLNRDSIHYEMLLQRAKANINIFLDDDALDNAMKMYKFLNKSVLKDRVRLIRCPNGYDASSLYQEKGKEGIIEVMRKAEKIDEYDLQFIA